MKTVSLLHYQAHFSDPIPVKRIGTRALAIAANAKEMSSFADEVEKLSKIATVEGSDALVDLLGKERASQALKLADGIRAFQNVVEATDEAANEDPEPAGETEETKAKKRAKPAK